MRASRLTPEERHEAASALAFAQESVIAKGDTPALQVGITGTGLDRDEPAVDHVENEAIDVGQLLAIRIDPVEIVVADRNEPLGGRRGGQPPGLQRRQIHIVELVHPVAAMVELDPVAGIVLAHQALQLVRIDIVGVELLQVMRRPVDEERRGGRDLGEEERVR